MLEITCRVANLGFLKFLGTYVHKEAQTRFVLHETWHKTLLGIDYCVQVVKIIIHTHILVITCQVVILSVFKAFLALSRIK